MYCSNCGTNNAPGAVLCANCGVSLAVGGPNQPPPMDQGYPPGPPPPGDPYPPAPGQYPGDAGQYPGDAGQYPGEYGQPPPGYPPAPPGYGPYGQPAPGPPPRKSQKGLLLAVLGVLVVAAIVAASVLVLTSGDDKAQKVVLEPIDSVTADSFTENLDTDPAAAGQAVGAQLGDAPDPRTEEVDETGLAGRVVDGAAPAVYGGSRDIQVCDIAGLVSFLTDEANADKAEAWAEELGIGVGDISTYVEGLTAVRLRFDTRVTNHGFTDGAANPFQSVLQAGTAVLVDDTGVPRVKCNCGNPLDEPEPIEGVSGDGALDVDSVAQNPDDAWETLDPAQVVKVRPSAQPVSAITIVDFEDGGLLDRPVGSDGESKTDTGAGEVKITLTWNSTADIDLHVTEPNGFEIYYGDSVSTATSGTLDVDSNVECADEGAIENVYWPDDDAESGTYVVSIQGFRFTTDDGTDCGSGDYSLTIKVAGQPDRVETGSVGQDESDEYTFDVP